MRQVTIIAGLLLAALPQMQAQAAGMMPAASLLPPGYAADPAMPMAPQDADRTGFGEAQLSPDIGPSESAAMDAMPTLAATPDQTASGMGQAQYGQAGQQMAGQGYVDLPPLAPVATTAPATPMQDFMQPLLQAAAPAPQPQRAAPNPALYTQGITTGPKAYNEGNFTFKP